MLRGVRGVVGIGVDSVIGTGICGVVGSGAVVGVSTTVGVGGHMVVTIVTIDHLSTTNNV